MGTEAATIETEIRKVRRVDVEMDLLNLPRPDAVLAAAQGEPPMPANLCASDYGESIDHLRELGFTWLEVHEWMHKSGVHMSYQAFVAGWRRWAIRNGKLQ